MLRNSKNASSRLTKEQVAGMQGVAEAWQPYTNKPYGCDDFCCCVYFQRDPSLPGMLPLAPVLGPSRILQGAEDPPARPTSSCRRLLLFFPPDPMGSYWIPPDPNGSQWIPLDPTGSHRIPLDPIGFQWIPLDPIGSYWIPPDPSGSYWILLDPIGSHLQGAEDPPARPTSSCRRLLLVLLVFPQDPSLPGKLPLAPVLGSSRSPDPPDFQLPSPAAAPTGSHRIPMDPRGSHWIPLDPTGSHWIPLDPSRSHWLPLGPTGSHRIPVDLTGSHWILLDPTGSHRIPPDPIGSHWIPMDPIGSHWFVLNPTGSHRIPVDPTGSHWILLDPTGSHWIHWIRTHWIPLHPTGSHWIPLSAAAYSHPRIACRNVLLQTEWIR